MRFFAKTVRAVHAVNDFSFYPISEDAVFSAGIFATMMLALDWLNLNARELLGGNPAPQVFFWDAGGLSRVLDNAPTFLEFVLKFTLPFLVPMPMIVWLLYFRG
jgi:hypothetical protein